jgi:hypothetical protein
MVDDMIGTVWRDTYGDKRRRNGRTVRIIEHTEDGRWLVEPLTTINGVPVEGPRRTRVSDTTLARQYERVQ